MFVPVIEPDHPALAHIQSLYETSFPVHERRTWAALKVLLAEPTMHVEAIMQQEIVVGFGIYWTLQNWIFLEHLAIHPTYQGRQFGRKFINHLKTAGNGPLILETELPESEQAVRRIMFYNQLGFEKVDYSYSQPPYKSGGKAHPMLLMSTTQRDLEEVEQLTKQIRQEVYERFY